MNAADFHDQVEAAKREYESASAALVERMTKMRRVIERHEQKLAALKQSLKMKLDSLTTAYAGLEEDGGSEIAAPVSQPIPRATSPNGSRAKRGAFDQPLLDLIVGMTTSPVTVPDVTMLWNALYADQPVTRSTVRGALERHARQGRLVVVNLGGRGSANPRTYGRPEKQ